MHVADRQPLPVRGEMPIFPQAPITTHNNLCLAGTSLKAAENLVYSGKRPHARRCLCFENLG
jgi:hypothetical protein